MSEPGLLQSPRRKLFAFSAVGAAMVFLPLLQLLQYQQAELQQLSAERALLDPLSLAVHTQFGLVAHRKVSHQMLNGLHELEPTRQAVQAGVDDQLAALRAELSRGLWTQALAESRALNQDWQTLTKQIATRSISAERSDEAHALRLEQTLQVMDLVGLDALPSDVTPVGSRAHKPPDNRADQHKVALRDADSHRVANFVASAKALARLLPELDTNHTAAQQALLQTQALLFEQARQAQARQSEQRVQQLQRQQTLTSLALLALAAVAAGLLARLWRAQTAAVPSAAASSTQAPITASPATVMAQHLMAATAERAARDGLSTRPGEATGQLMARLRSPSQRTSAQQDQETG